MTTERPKAIKVFYCYSHKDKRLRDELERHLATLKRLERITGWYDRQIEAGTEWEQEIERQLDAAGIILLLISPDFINSDYCYSTEMQRALELHKAGRARVIPIILRPVDWQGTPIAQLQVLPSEGRPVTSSFWRNQGEAFYNVARGIRRVVETLSPQPLPPASLTQASQYSQASELQSDPKMLSEEKAVQPAKAEATDIAYPSYLPGNGTLALFDPLNDKNTSKWGTGINSPGGNCRRFINGAYHVSQSSQADYIMNCQALGIFSNFIFEVQMKIIQGNCDGMIFRNSGPFFYLFRICQDGTYTVSIGGATNIVLLNGHSSAINTGQNQANKIAVVANGATLTFFANEQQIGQVQDSTIMEGMIGLIAYPGTKAAYTNARIWTL